MQFFVYVFITLHVLVEKKYIIYYTTYYYIIVLSVDCRFVFVFFGCGDIQWGGAMQWGGAIRCVDVPQQSRLHCIARVWESV